MYKNQNNEASEKDLSMVIGGKWEKVSKKEYDSLLKEQTAKREELIARNREENKKSFEILKKSGLSDEAIAILKPDLV